MADLTPEQVEDAFDREAERIAEVEAADAERAQPGVGFVGCGASGRVLRVRVANRTRQRMRVVCPHGCGEHSTPKAMARALLEGESRPELVEIPPADLERDPKDRGSGRRQVSDAAIFDTIPVGHDVILGDAAEELGYGVPSSGGRASALASRLRRMNKRAENEGVSPPFILTRRQLRGGSKTMFVRRAA